MPALSGKGERPGCPEGRPCWRRNEGHGWPNGRGLEGKNEAWDFIPGATRDFGLFWSRGLAQSHQTILGMISWLWGADHSVSSG